jgi:hypothetical protein
MSIKGHAPDLELNFLFNLPGHLVTLGKITQLIIPLPADRREQSLPSESRSRLIPSSNPLWVLAEWNVSPPISEEFPPESAGKPVGFIAPRLPITEFFPLIRGVLFREKCDVMRVKNFGGPGIRCPQNLRAIGAAYHHSLRTGAGDSGWSR